VLVHARGASRGNPRDNKNNHPIHAGLSAVIHNGTLKNSDEMFDKMKLERKAEPDTDIARAIFDKWGFSKEAIKMLNRASGSGAIAAVHPEFPDKLMLIRSGNPLTLASNEDFFFFSSEKTTLHKACRPFVMRRGMWFQAQRPDVDFANMANDTAWLIGPKGLELHAECKICRGEYQEPWRRTYEEYEKRQEKWSNLAKPPAISKDGKMEMKPAYCWKCDRDWMIPINAIYSQYTCDSANGGCGQSLWQPRDLSKIRVIDAKVN
jgi:asparagine synthetase B (glutamine-hydrolysing)